MARTKKQTDAPPVIGRLTVLTTNEWLSWVRNGAHHCRTDISKLVDSALIEYLKARGFPDEPPHRIP